jgi:hypothetical protein
MAADIANVAHGNVEVMLGQRHRSDDRPLIGGFMVPVVSSNTLQEAQVSSKPPIFSASATWSTSWVMANMTSAISLLQLK